MDLLENLFWMGIIWYVIFLFSVVAHECAHAAVAYVLGDATAYLGGQVSLDPAPHLWREPFGLLVLPILSFLIYQGQFMVGFAWIPLDPSWAWEHPKRAALVALAGPIANLLLATLAGVILACGLIWGWFEPPKQMTNIFTDLVLGAGILRGVSIALSLLFSLNLLLFLFNLIPLPPLDGGTVLMLFLDRQSLRYYREFLYHPAVRLPCILIAWYLLKWIFYPVFIFAINIVYSPLDLQYQ